MDFRILDNRGGTTRVNVRDAEGVKPETVLKYAAEDWHDLMCLFPVWMPSLYPIYVEAVGAPEPLSILFDSPKDHSIGKKKRTERLLRNFSVTIPEDISS